jgi:hypothetical protein
VGTEVHIVLGDAIQGLDHCLHVGVQGVKVQALISDVQFAHFVVLVVHGHIGLHATSVLGNVVKVLVQTSVDVVHLFFQVVNLGLVLVLVFVDFLTKGVVHKQQVGTDGFLDNILDPVGDFFRDAMFRGQDGDHVVEGELPSFLEVGGSVLPNMEMVQRGSAGWVDRGMDGWGSRCM